MDKDKLPVEITKLESPTNVEAYEQDFAYVRANLYELIDKGKYAVDELATLANQMQHPRAYEVLASFITQLSKANRDLLEMRQMQFDSHQRDTPTNITNNNLFVGSATELLQQLKQIEDEKTNSKTIETDFITVPKFDEEKKNGEDE